MLHETGYSTRRLPIKNHNINILKMKRTISGIILLFAFATCSLAKDYKHLSQEVKAGEMIKINMVSGGGWVAKITSKQ